MDKNEKDKMTRNCIIGIIGMLFPIILATIKHDTYYGVGVWLSVQYITILFGTVIIIAFLVFKMKLGTAKIYFSTTIHVMLATFAAFGIAFSILWGNLYTYAIQIEGMTPYINNLRGQGLILLLLVIIASAVVLFTFLIPLIRQINEKES